MVASDEICRSAMGVEMQTIDIECHFIITPQPGGDLTDGGVETIIDTVTDELIKLGFENVTIGGSVTQRSFDIGMQASGSSFANPMIHVDSGLRTAFHAADVATPGWERPIHAIAEMNRQQLTFLEPQPA